MLANVFYNNTSNMSANVSKMSMCTENWRVSSSCIDWKLRKEKLEFCTFFAEWVVLHILISYSGRVMSNLVSHWVKSVQIWSYFWSVFSCIRIEYGDLRSKSRYNNSVFGRFSRSVSLLQVLTTKTKMNYLKLAFLCRFN